MTFFRPVSMMKTTIITNGVLAGEEALKGKSRHAVCVTSVGQCYIGTKEETEAGKGMKLKDGERVFLPLEPSRCDQLYIKGKAELTEFF